VGFRYSAISQANYLGIKGFVKNMPDGSVYLEIEGSELATELMIKWCRTGPGTGRVDVVDVYAGSLVNFQSFSLKY
jgi:acylphosphatase